MASSVGGVACDLVHGVAGDLQERTDTWQVPGLAGVGLHTLGKGGVRFGFVAIEFGTSAAVDTWYTAIQALVGTIITVVDDWNKSHTDLVLESVSQLQKSVALNEGGARGELRLSTLKSA